MCMLIPVPAKTDNAHKTRKVRENNHKIIPNTHAYLLTMEKTFAKFQNDWRNIGVGGQITSYPLTVYSI